MRRVKKRIISGAVCEQMIYSISDGEKSIKKAKPRLRFKNAEERAKHRDGIARRNHARRFNANFSPTSLYSTLTFDNECEVHIFKEARKVRDNYVRRLKRRYPEAIIFIYMGRGKNTQRIHFHMVSEGIPEAEIIKIWGQGDIRRCEPLREHNYYDGKDYGRDYTGLAGYLFDHWTPEQGGHRWKQTKNAKDYDSEDAAEAVRVYSESKPPIAPKGFKLVETMCTSYGYQYFKYILTPPKRRRIKSLVNV